MQADQLQRCLLHLPDLVQSLSSKEARHCQLIRLPLTAPIHHLEQAHLLVYTHLLHVVLSLWSSTQRTMAMLVTRQWILQRQRNATPMHQTRQLRPTAHTSSPTCRLPQAPWCLHHRHDCARHLPRHSPLHRLCHRQLRLRHHLLKANNAA